MNYVIDQFADINLVRFDITNFNELTLEQKKHIYYLSEAALYGRDIIWHQKYRYNILLRNSFEKIIEANVHSLDGYPQLEEYMKRFFFSHGFFHHYNKNKFFPACSRSQLKNILENSNLDESFNINQILEIIFQDDNSKETDLLLKSTTNFYENISETEALNFYGEMENKNSEEPLEYGLNTRLIKENDGIKEINYSEFYQDSLKHVIQNLKLANQFSENEKQKEHTNLLIEYLENGDLKIWEQYNIKWLQDNESFVDFINGFIEVYEDPIGYKGSYESLVNIKNIKETKLTEIIAQNAQWFEDNSPTDKKYKKDKVTGVSAKVIDAIMLSGDMYPASAIGINLPNSDWIRRKFGSKSVSISNISKAIDKARIELPNQPKEEFSYSNKEYEFEKKYGSIADELHTHLHECLGHGSGKLLAGVTTKNLKEFHSTIEEARADIFSLFFMKDKKMLELNILPNLEIADNYYLSYIKNGLLVQLARIPLGLNIKESHMQSRKLISEWSYELGKNENVIELIKKDNKTYIKINDFDKLRNIFGEILKEIQRITSEGDYQAAKKLVEKYATSIDSELHKEVIERFNKLNAKPYFGFINCEIVPITENNEVIDYQIQYCYDFLKQQIDYAAHYSTLKKERF